MWPEGLRGTETMRIQIAKLLDYTPSPSVAIQKTPDTISYAEADISKLSGLSNTNSKGKIAGKHSGHIEYRRLGKEAMESMAGSIEAVYANYSDDGERFYNGYEKTSYSVFEESIYETDLTMSGVETGEMKLRATFSKIVGGDLPKLLFEQASDGKPKSYGYTTNRGVTLNIEDMLE